jgi:hypothetical protein
MFDSSILQCHAEQLSLCCAEKLLERVEMFEFHAAEHALARQKTHFQCACAALPAATSMLPAHHAPEHALARQLTLF